MEQMTPEALDPATPIDLTGLLPDREMLWSGVPWPLRDGSVRCLSAHDLLERIPIGVRIPVDTAFAKVYGRDGLKRKQALTITQDVWFWFFDEAWRVTKPGGTFVLSWMAPGTNDDPTIRRQVPVSALDWLSRQGRRAKHVVNERIECDWRLRSWSKTGDSLSAVLARME